MRIFSNQQSTTAMLKTSSLLLFSIIAVSACSSKQLYNAVQENRLQECRKLYGAQREECEARYQKDYETYERERDQVLADKTQEQK